ncbi:MAG: hypothetical protein KatS3mg082_0926 [Nitrospiraceae bacterium]|nr:MAG: hypothetical protein KatS3mg082_0926 [Nitrospiraceae bacterium]
MKSRLQFRGHPIHAMMVGFPIGLYPTALVCDVLYLLLRDAFWFRTAYWALVFGVVTHLGAAATGFPDFLTIIRERMAAVRHPALSHLVFGVGLLVIQGLNLAVRNGGDLPASGSVALPVIVNVIGAALTGVQGWYGGELVYRHFVGIDLPETAPPGKHQKDKRHH